MAPKQMATKPKKSSKRLAAKAKEEKKKAAKIEKEKKIAKIKEEKMAAKIEKAKEAEELAKEWKSLTNEIEKYTNKAESMEKELKKRENLLAADKKKKAKSARRYKAAMKSLMGHVRKEMTEAEGQPALPEEMPVPMLCNRCQKAYCDKKDVLGTTPRVLGCGHSMCERCIGELIVKGEVVCPMDKEAHKVGSDGLKQFKKNFRVMSMFE